MHDPSLNDESVGKDKIGDLQEILASSRGFSDGCVFFMLCLMN